MIKPEQRQIYELQRIREYEELKGVSGIYALLFQSFNAVEPEVIYIGQAQDIYKRLCDHYSHSFSNYYKHHWMYRFLRRYMGSIQFVYVPVDVSLLNQIEPQYISKWRPRFNVEGKTRPYRGVYRKPQSAF